MSKENTIKNIKEVLASHEIGYTDEYVEKFYDYSYSAKSKLRDLFRNHPNWDEEADGIVFLTDEIRSINQKNVFTNAEALYKYVYSKADEENRQAMLADEMWNTYLCLRGIWSQFVTDEIKNDLFEFGFKTRKGEKMSRVWNRFFNQFKNGDTPAGSFTDKTADTPADYHGWLSYDKLYAKLADSLSPMTVKRITVLSLNPVDFLNMSYGTDWKSCHRLGEKGNRGEYSGGTLSYALDDVTAILYTVSSEYEGTEYCRQKKINRQLFMYNGNVFLQSRLYPDYNDTAKSDSYRTVVQHIIADCLKVPNLWTVNKSHRDFEGKLITAYHSRHYPDYNYNKYNCTLSYLKGTDLAKWKIRIGHEAFCLNCGRTHDENYRVECYDCDNNSNYCTYCNTHHALSDLTRITVRGTAERLCPDCLARYNY